MDWLRTIGSWVLIVVWLCALGVAAKLFFGAFPEIAPGPVLSLQWELPFFISLYVLMAVTAFPIIGFAKYAGNKMDEMGLY